MKDCMLDLETLGRTADAVIIQIGLCRFDIRTGERDEGFEVNIDLEDSIRQGFRLEGPTIEWWLRQSREARESVIAHPKYPVKVALRKAQQYMKGADTLWSHATFDAPILSYHFNRMKVKQPIHYRGHRDIRTLVALTGFKRQDIKSDPGSVKHTALADCITQIAYCSQCYKNIKRL